VRLHYVYPYPHVDDVLPLMADGLVLPYLDIPFQHASPTVLKAMRRPAHQEKTAERIRTWRQAVPELAIRSTFIVGFPGETEGDFDLLLQWIKEARINRAGCFKYEPVDGAAANDLPGAVPEAVKEERWHRFMAAQQDVSRTLMAQKVGYTIDVLIDTVDGGKTVGRSQWDAPEIDGNVHLDSASGAKPGDIVSAKVVRSDEYDLWAVPS
jgi:ribosomal protein S12 methylthiotransferase